MNSTFVSRAEWGARAARTRTALSASDVTIHWAGTPSGFPFDHDHCATVVRSFQAYHMDTQGWADIAYNLLVCPHGSIFEGRGVGIRSAANGDVNSNSASFAVCYILGTGEPFTDQAADAINDAVEMLGGSTWSVHRRWTGSECPGNTIIEWVEAGHERKGHVAPTPPVEGPCEDRVFQLGDNGRCVIYIQRLLNKRRGYNLVDDGDFGPLTHAAVKKFQRNRKGPVDGIVGPLTWKALWWKQTL